MRKTMLLRGICNIPIPVISFTLFCRVSWVLAQTADPTASVSVDPPRKYLIERVDDAAIVQLYVDGFKKLSLRERVLVYHLSQAAIAGRDIFIDQKYEHSLEIRDVIEEIITHADGIDPKTLTEIRRYAKLFWLNKYILETLSR